MIIMYPCLYSVSAPLEAIALLLEQLINQQARSVKVRSRESLKDFAEVKKYIFRSIIHLLYSIIVAMSY